MPDYMLFDAFGDGPSDETFLGRLTQEHISILGKNAYLALIEGESEVHAVLDLHHSDGGETAGYVVEQVCGSGVRNPIKICRSWRKVAEIIEENDMQDQVGDAISLEARKLVRVLDFENGNRMEKSSDQYILILNNGFPVYGLSRTTFFQTMDAAINYARAVEMPLERLEVARVTDPRNEMEGEELIGYVVEQQPDDGKTQRWGVFQTLAEVFQFCEEDRGLKLSHRKLIFEKSLDELAVEEEEVDEEENQMEMPSPSP